MALLADEAKQALIHARHAVALEPDNALCHSAVAEALVDLGQRAEAIQEMEKALRRAPTDDVVLCHAIRVYRDAHELDRAFEVADRATRTHPEDAETWRLRAELHLWHGSVVEAFRSAKRASDLSPLKYDPRAFRTAAYAHGLLGEWREAKQCFLLAGPQERRWG
jgi:tetratricopeptide (TPR) repeat protein